MSLANIGPVIPPYLAQIPWVVRKTGRVETHKPIVASQTLLLRDSWSAASAHYSVLQGRLTLLVTKLSEGSRNDTQDFAWVNPYAVLYNSGIYSACVWTAPLYDRRVIDNRKQIRHRVSCQTWVCAESLILMLPMVLLPWIRFIWWTQHSQKF